MTKLPYMALYVNDLLGSFRFKKMKDFQKCWYLMLLIESWNSEKPGYIPNNPEVLWELARAGTKQFFEGADKKSGIARNAVVLACFKKTPDGAWLYNEKLLAVYEEQSKKSEQGRSRRKSAATEAVGEGLSESTLDLDFDSESDLHLVQNPKPKTQKVHLLPEYPEWFGEPELKAFKDFMVMRRTIKKPLTESAIARALAKLAELRASGEDPIAVMNQSVDHCWQGLFPVGGERNNGNHAAKGNTRAQQIQNASNDAIKAAVEQRRAGRVARAENGDGPRGVPEPGNHGRDRDCVPGTVGKAGAQSGPSEV